MAEALSPGDPVVAGLFQRVVAATYIVERRQAVRRGRCPSPNGRACRRPGPRPPRSPLER